MSTFSSASPCRCHPGFSPGILLGRILHGPSLRLHPGCLPGILLGRILHGLSLWHRPGFLPGSLDCVSLPGSTLPSLPGHAELPCWHWLGFLPSLPSLSLCLIALVWSVIVCQSLCSQVLVLSCFCLVLGVPH